MKTKDQCKFPGGVFKIQVFDGEKLVQEKEFHNKMTNASLAVITGLVGDTGSQDPFTYLAVGTSSTAVSAAHTGLQAEVVASGLARAAATVSRVTTTQINDTLVLEKTFSVTGTIAIEEMGIFNASSAGVMLARALSGTVSVANSNTIVVTYSWVVVGN